MTPGQRVWAFLGSFEGGCAVLVALAVFGLLVRDLARFRREDSDRDQ